MAARPHWTEEEIKAILTDYCNRASGYSQAECRAFAAELAPHVQRNQLACMDDEDLRQLQERSRMCVAPGLPSARDVQGILKNYRRRRPRRWVKEAAGYIWSLIVFDLLGKEFVDKPSGNATIGRRG